MASPPRERRTLEHLPREVSRLTCRNFMVDPTIASSRVTFVSSAEVRVEDLFGLLLQSLVSPGLAIVDRGEYQAVIRAADGTRSALPLYGPNEALPAEERMVTKLFRLEDPSRANDLSNFLDIFKSTKGQIHPYSAQGLLVATDYVSSLRRLEHLDRPEAAPPSTK